MADDIDAILQKTLPDTTTTAGGDDIDALLNKVNSTQRLSITAKPGEPGYVAPGQTLEIPDSAKVNTATSLPSTNERNAALGMSYGEMGDYDAAGAAQQAKDNAAKEAAFVKENSDKSGVPLDINDTVELGLRFALSTKHPDEVVKTLAAEGRNPRPSADGKNIVVRSADGKKDVLFYPYGSVDIAGNVAPALMGAGKMAAGSLVGNPEFAAGQVFAPGASVGLGSLASRALAASTIPATTLIGGGTPKEAAADTALNAGFPLAVNGVTGVASRALTALRSAGTPEAQAALDAARSANQRLGLPPPIPPRVFSSMQTPLAGKIGQAAVDEQNNALAGALTNRGIGSGANVPLESDISKNAVAPLADVGANAQRVADLINSDTRGVNAAREADALRLNTYLSNSSTSRLAAARDAAQQVINKGVADTLGPRAVTANTEMGVGSQMVGAVRGIDEAATKALDKAKKEIFNAAPDATVSLDNLNALRANLRASVSPLGADVEPLLAQIDSKIKTLVQGGKSTLVKAGEEGAPSLAGLRGEEGGGALDTAQDMADLSQQIRDIDAKLAGKVYGKEKADLLTKRLQLGAYMGHKPSEDALMKLEQAGNDPNAVIRGVVEDYGINSNHPVMGGEIRNLAENGVPKRLITPKGANPDDLGAGINEALVANGLPPIEGITESGALQAVNDAYQKVPDKFPPKVDLPLVGKPASKPLAGTSAKPGMVEVPPAEPIRLTPSQADELRQYIDSGITFKDAGNKGDALKIAFRNALRDDTAASLEAHTEGLGKQYTDALTKYSDTATRLGDARVKPALLGDETGRSIAPENVVDNLLANRGSPSGLTAWETALGRGSPEVDAALRQGLARTVAKAGGDPAKLVADLGNMHPEFRARLLGPKSDEIMESLGAQSVLSKAANGTDVLPSELAAAMKASPPDVADATQKAIDAAKASKDKFTAVLDKETAKPEMSPLLADVVNKQPEHLVSYLDNAGSADKTKAVLGLLDSQTKDDFYRRALQNILDKSGEISPKTQLPTGRLDPNKLRAALGKGDGLANVREMVGGDTPVQFINDLADTLTQQNSNVAASEASKITAGGLYHGIKEGGVAGLGSGLLVGSPATGSALGAGVGLLAKTIPRTGQALLGGAMRNEAVRQFLVTGEIPAALTKAKDVLQGAAQASPFVLQAQKALTQKQQRKPLTATNSNPADAKLPLTATP